MNITINKKKSLNDITILAKKAVQQAKIDKAQVVAVFDVSGSMRGMYRDGTVRALATRVLAVAMQLDDNGIIPVYALDEGCRRIEDLSEKNLEDYVENNLSELVGGGTNYAPSINEVVKDAEEGDPMLVLLFTDGANADRQDSRDALVNASQLPIFFQWFGIYEGNTEPSFDFLHKMDEMKGRTVDNAGFSPLSLSTVESGNTDADDSALFNDMLKEYKDFPEKAAKAGATWGNLSQAKPRKKLFGLF